MSGDYLLDTNIVIRLLENDPEVKAQFEAASEAFLPTVAVGELHYGAACSARPESNSARVDAFAATCTVLGVDIETARQYGLLKGELRRKGRLIPENDLWIAALARQHDLRLASRDRHFEHVDGLQVETW